jgi:hypothetical protein
MQQPQQAVLGKRNHGYIGIASYFPQIGVWCWIVTMTALCGLESDIIFTTTGCKWLCIPGMLEKSRKKKNFKKGEGGFNTVDTD